MPHPIRLEKPGRAAPSSREGGFTMIKLIVIMVILGIMAAYAVPKMAAAINMRESTWRDEVVAALRYANKSAVARRRLTCVTVAAGTVTLTGAAANPAVTCTASLPGPDGNAVFATASHAAVTAVAPAGVLYFQPDGRVTTDGAGTLATDRTITMSGAPNITVYAETGYVQ